jgi:hypothetical protein
VITLTSAVAADPSIVRTWPDFAAYLDDIHQRSGKTLADLHKFGQGPVRPGERRGGLPTSTVSDALNGKRHIKKDLLLSLLRAWNVSSDQRRDILDAWGRLNATVGQGPANAGRVDEASPRELGVHPAISVAGVTDELPSYVPRDFDGDLRDRITVGAERGCFVLLMGGSSCGKTRSLYEAVFDLVPDWWLVHPTGTQEIQDLLKMPAERTVLWLDEFHRFLGADPPLRRADVVTLTRAQMIVVGTLWPEHYFPRKRLHHGEGDDVHADDRALLGYADMVNVPETLTAEEEVQASKIARDDSRIRAALAVADAGLTQVLAAGPDLVNVWEQAPDPYSKAIISAAADARRLGVRGPLSPGSLTEAMAGYLSPAHRVRRRDEWLDRALRHAGSRLHGQVSALTPVSGNAGSADGYEVADYLTQHIGRTRRVTCPPDSLWTALATATSDLDDLRRLAGTALARLRYPYAEPVLRTLHRAGDHKATAELIVLFRRQDRLTEAIAVADTWLAADPRNQDRRRVRAELIGLQARAEHLRETASRDARAAELLAELLTDGGRADELRARAATGNAVAVENLADLLAERGCVAELWELADSGHQYAADRLAELLAILGRIDDLRTRADRGDRAAALHLVSPAQRNEVSVDAQVARLRAAADGGNEDAARELTALLLEAGDRYGLLGEVNAGTYLAATRYLALLTADPEVDRRDIRIIQAFGLRADGSPSGPRTAP